MAYLSNLYLLESYKVKRIYYFIIKKLRIANDANAASHYLEIHIQVQMTYNNDFSKFNNYTRRYDPQLVLYTSLLACHTSLCYSSRILLRYVKPYLCYFV